MSSSSNSAVKQTKRTKFVCPKCGHDDFKSKSSMWTWLIGERFLCAKCGDTFKYAKVSQVEVVRVEEEKPAEIPVEEKKVEEVPAVEVQVTEEKIPTAKAKADPRKSGSRTRSYSTRKPLRKR